MSENIEDELPVASIKPFGLRLQRKLKRQLEDAAKVNNRSLNAEITARLEVSFTPEMPWLQRSQLSPLARLTKDTLSADARLEGLIDNLERRIAAIEADIKNR